MHLLKNCAITHKLNRVVGTPEFKSNCLNVDCTKILVTLSQRLKCKLPCHAVAHCPQEMKINVRKINTGLLKFVTGY